MSDEEALEPSRPPFHRGGNDQHSQVQQADVRGQEVPTGLGQVLGDPDKCQDEKPHDSGLENQREIRKE